MMKCFICNENKAEHEHHIIPKSKGGTKTISICINCHNQIHGLKLDSTHLTRYGIMKLESELYSYIFWELVQKNEPEIILKYINNNYQKMSKTRFNSKIINLLLIDNNDIKNLLEPILKLNKSLYFTWEYVLFEWEFVRDWLLNKYAKKNQSILKVAV